MKKLLYLFLICLLTVSLTLLVACGSSGGSSSGDGGSSEGGSEDNNQKPGSGNEGEKDSFDLSYYIDGRLYSEKTFDGKSAIPFPEDPSKEGYTFAGWFTDERFTEAFTKDTLVKENLDIYAKFEPLVYEITFIVEGKTVGVVEYTVETEEVAPPNVADRKGYEIAWESFSLEGGSFEVEGSYVLKSYTITFTANGDVIEEIKYTVETESVSEPSIPAKDGYSAEWADYTLDIGDLTVEAEYTPIIYKAIFTADGVVVEEIDYTVETESLDEPIIPEKHGYSAEWSEYTLNIGGVTVEAIYTPIPVTVKLMLNYEATPDFIDYTTEDGYVKLVPEREGYEFNGWWLSSGMAAGEQLLFERFDTSKLVLDEGLVLYAEWVEIPTDDKQLPAPSVTVDGKLFSWDAVDGAESYTLTLYMNGETVLEITDTATEWLFPETMEAGFYRVQVKANGNGYNTINSSTVTKYFSHNVLAGVKNVHFDITTSLLTFDPIAGVDHYNIYVNGDLVLSTNEVSFDMNAYEAGYHYVTVEAVKENWASSSYNIGIEKKRLKAPEAEIRFDAESMSYIISWDEVAYANTYIIAIGDSELRTSELSYTIPYNSDILPLGKEFSLTVSAYDSTAEHFISENNKEIGTAKYAKVSLTNDNGGLTLYINGTNVSEGGFTVGSEITVSAEVASGYNFVGWFIGDESVSSELSYSFTVSEGDNALLASSSYYTLSTHRNLADAGTVTRYWRENISVGTKLTLEVTVNNGYNFVGWYVNGEFVSSETTLEFVMPAEEVMIDAEFSYYTVSVKSSSENGGTVTDCIGRLTSIGTEVTVNATPNNGFRFIGWYVNDELVSEDNEYTFTMKAESILLIAKWEAIPTTLYYYVNGELYGTAEYTNEKPITEFPTYTAASGEHFVGWYSNRYFSTTDTPITSTVDLVADENNKAYLYGGTYIGSSGFRFVYSNDEYRVIGSPSGSVITVPGEFNGMNIAVASNIASTTATSLIFSEGIERIEGMGSLNNVTKIVISASVTTLDGAFNGLRSVKTVEFAEDSKLHTIKDASFGGTRSLTTLEIPASVKVMSGTPFYYLANIQYAGTIEDWCAIKFESSSANPMFRATKFFMKNDAGEYEEVTKIEIPSSVTVIGDAQFYGFDNVTSITLNEGITSIGRSAFSTNKNLTSFTIPSTVKYIGDCAFFSCGNLTSISFVDSSSEWHLSYYQETATLSVANASTNVTNLTNTYTSYTWTKIEKTEE